MAPKQGKNVPQSSESATILNLSAYCASPRGLARAAQQVRQAVAALQQLFVSAD
jgi:hypothetical protein